jgi:hypothetical protein
MEQWERELAAQVLKNELRRPSAKKLRRQRMSAAHSPEPKKAARERQLQRRAEYARETGKVA